MATCSVRWRSSGGRGEFEFVPADSLEGREVHIFLEVLNLTIPAEVRGERRQGKPRLRKHEGTNRRKLHLPQLVMAIARLPEPAREDTLHAVTFPLQSKSFVMDAMDFDIIEDDGLTVTLAPLRVSIRNAKFQVDLQDRINAIAEDLQNLSMIKSKHPDLGAAIDAHGTELKKAVNSSEIRLAADAVNNLQAEVFGLTNAGSATKLEEAAAKPPVELEEEIFGVEGKLLTRIHVYKERDKAFASRAKKYYKDKTGGQLWCQACGMDPLAKYGADGERCLEAHHQVPIEELQPDSITRVDEMAIVCASCHRIIHSKKPCLSVKEVAQMIAAGTTPPT